MYLTRFSPLLAKKSRCHWGVVGIAMRASLAKDFLVYMSESCPASGRDEKDKIERLAKKLLAVNFLI
jgi:hypothetical protein